MKTITLEEIYADPHVLEPLLAGGQLVAILEKGKPVGDLVPRKQPTPEKKPARFHADEHRAWFLKTYGPDAFKSTRSVQDIIDHARQERSPSENE